MTAREMPVLSLSAHLILLGLVASSLAFADSRDDFVQNVLPKKYPQLVRYVRAEGTLPVVWTSQTGEHQSLTVEVTVRESVMITTMAHTGFEKNMNTPTMVIMIDRNLDSRLDYILWLPQGDEPQMFESPTDEASLFLWDMALATIMKSSDCCPE